MLEAERQKAVEQLRGTLSVSFLEKSKFLIKIEFLQENVDEFWWKNKILKKLVLKGGNICRKSKET